MENQFGERIKQLRETNRLLQRQVASMLEIDTPMLSKIERGERKAKNEQVLKFAEIFACDKNELLSLWMEDQIYDIIKGSPLANNVLKSLTKKLNQII